MPKLDRIPYFDERSRNFSIRTLTGPGIDRNKRRVWSVRSEPLDQGSEGACVGFAWAGELAATPVKYSYINNAHALNLYRAAQIQDRQMGNNWPEGASLLAGAKACAEGGLIKRYHWAFGINDVMTTIQRKGPVVLGINWYESMYETEWNFSAASPFVEVIGSVVGGHAILVNGYIPGFPVIGDCFVLTNSWGKNWGVNGSALISFADLDRLLQEQGEACVPTDTRAGK